MPNLKWLGVTAAQLQGVSQDTFQTLSSRDRHAICGVLCFLNLAAIVTTTFTASCSIRGMLMPDVGASCRCVTMQLTRDDAVKPENMHDGALLRAGR